jgi:uncharacterized protein
MRGDLTVAEAALALGTSPQTIRTMLRKGQLPGRQRPWGSRYVWEVSSTGLDAFLAEHGRLDGQRRTHRVTAPGTQDVAIDVGTGAWSTELHVAPPPAEDVAPAAEPVDVARVLPPAADTRPFVRRPRGRATVISVVLGVPLVAAHLVARTLPAALWFDEVRQGDVFTRSLLAQLEFRLLVITAVAVFMSANLCVACRSLAPAYRRAGVLVAVIASFVTGGMFASAVAGHWQTFLLWWHRQPFGVVDPVHGKDVGFFVFSLPLELLVSDLLIWLVAVTSICAALVYAGCGRLDWRRRRASFGAQQHLAALAAVLLLAVAWRIHLQTYVLELQQPSAGDPDAFAGADYVDVHVRMPGLTVLTVIAIVLAAACVVAPWVAVRRGRRSIRLLLGVPFGLLMVGATLALVVVPALVQRFVVDPNPLLREQALLEQSIAGTRHGLALDGADVQPYAPSHSFDAADYAGLVPRLRQVQIWDNDLLGSRMRQLVTGTPYFSPEDESLDVARVDGRRQPTVVSARELDLDAVRDRAGTWINDRLAYTHGLGLIRFSGTDTGSDRGPRLLDSGLGLHQPRIYFGDLSGASSADEGAAVPDLTHLVSLTGASWVLVDTRRPEVDTATPSASPGAPYHYTGSGGIALSSWLRRAAFALALDNKQLILSHDITPQSRVLLHRDVHDRLHTLAPFIHWDAHAVPLTTHGHVLFAVDGYTTSSSYPYSARFQLGSVRATYARPSVRATVDAFSGRVHIYLTDPEDPLARAWSAAYPSLFQRAGSLPSSLRNRWRYPSELFDAQATAYERFHTVDADVFTSDSDAWSRPIALSGPIEVASGVDFDQSDEDDLRLTMQPSYTWSSPPGSRTPRLTLSTYYVPSQGQNLVATLSGWIDGDGHPRLTATSLPRDPVTLGPAQVSRLVFATPRVRNLLGLRNLEIRDLNTSSLDSVILGRPHLLFLPGGVMQIQSLYEGSRGPGAARLLGVTAYINGRAGLGPDIESAVRQALNEPPLVDVRPVHDPATVRKHLSIRFAVQNAQRETILITTASGRTRLHRRVVNGHGTVSWTPKTAGPARVRVVALGLDGTEVSDSTVLQILRHPPSVRLLGTQGRLVVGKPVRIPFQIGHGHHALATISNRTGIAFSRHYDLSDGSGVVEWTPDSAGRATLRVLALGHQQQTATVILRLRVHRAPESPPPPSVELLHVPAQPTVGRAGDYAFRATGCSVAVARILHGGKPVATWRFTCTEGRSELTWTPAAEGRYEFVTVAHDGSGLVSSQTMRISVQPAPSGTAPSSGPSATASP